MQTVLDRRAAVISGALIVMLIALVGARSWVPVRYYAHFDSDQAVFGLMARDLAAGRAFPMFFYGQRYMLAVSVWLCAPLFAAFGVTITTLKLPLFLMNIGVVCLLWVGLRRESAMGPWGTALAILPFAMTSAVISTRLVEPQGGNIEPFVFVLAAFFLRARPIALGVLLGVAFLNREFSLIAFIALLMMDAAQGTLRPKFKQHAMTVLCIAATVIALRVLALWSTSYFGTLASYKRGGVENLVPLFGQHLPALIGGSPGKLIDFNIMSTLTVGHDLVYYAVIAWLILVAVTCAVPQRLQRQELNGMSAYLILIGGGQCAAFVLLSPYPHDIMVVRYILLALLAVCGLVALAWRRPSLRGVTAAVVVLMTAANLAGNVRLIHEYASTPVERPLNQLAAALVQRGVRYLQADYWTAYDVAWLTGERVISSPPGAFGRMPRYREALDTHRSEMFTLESSPREGCETIVRWRLCPPAPRTAQENSP
jgi:hypothetical protein